MRRRDVLAGIVGLSAASALRGAGGAARPAGPAFDSDWHRWPDMVWTGADCWAQPMQDWTIVDGALACVTAAPGRTLHLLTCQASARAQPFGARLELERPGERMARG